MVENRHKTSKTYPYVTLSDGQEEMMTVDDFFSEIMANNHKKDLETLVKKGFMCSGDGVKPRRDKITMVGKRTF